MALLGGAPSPKRVSASEGDAAPSQYRGGRLAKKRGPESEAIKKTRKREAKGEVERRKSGRWATSPGVAVG